MRKVRGCEDAACSLGKQPGHARPPLHGKAAHAVHTNDSRARAVPGGQAYRRLGALHTGHTYALTCGGGGGHRAARKTQPGCCRPPETGQTVLDRGPRHHFSSHPTAHAEAAQPRTALNAALEPLRQSGGHNADAPRYPPSRASGATRQPPALLLCCAHLLEGSGLIVQVAAVQAHVGGLGGSLGLLEQGAHGDAALARGRAAHSRLQG